MPIPRMLALAAGAIAFAAVMLLLLSVPGLLSDRDSTVPMGAPRAAG